MGHVTLNEHQKENFTVMTKSCFSFSFVEGHRIQRHLGCSKAVQGRGGQHHEQKRPNYKQAGKLPGGHYTQNWSGQLSAKTYRMCQKKTRWLPIWETVAWCLKAQEVITDLV